MRSNTKKNQKLFKVIRIVSMILLAVLLVLVVYVGSLPKKYDVTQGQISDYDINSTRSVKDSYETERRAILAKTQISPIYIISENISDENLETVESFFNYCAELRKGNVDEFGQVGKNKQEMCSLLISAVKESYGIELSQETAYTLANISFVDYSYVQTEAKVSRSGDQRLYFCDPGVEDAWQ